MKRLETLKKYKNEDGTYSQKGALVAMREFGERCFHAGYNQARDKIMDYSPEVDTEEEYLEWLLREESE